MTTVRPWPPLFGTLNFPVGWLTTSLTQFWALYINHWVANCDCPHLLRLNEQRCMNSFL
ncbi:hypothetical protein K450DRAFT_262209 [Umbelopsis ramanniana AG]|uniref:Uncharacterized protein n=1 Tax=Umbelopsis ramanniana AG TaxID=1314678 RepID=A0AAD5HAB6_UMBRA|nr:uncharacterized protein K450DRAFT_262209 [Umbelopsis ramanniana AG]KAI8575356.1 hypothetical protein K450DRAFT_262209 [Umbelopsis ramanniana AG]